MKNFIYSALFLLFNSCICYSQDNPKLTPPNYSAVINEQDSVNTEFLIMVSGGFSIPMADYNAPTPPNGYNESATPTIYGYASVGYHIGATGIYLSSKNVGLALQYGLDINSALYKNSAMGNNTMHQILAGIYAASGNTKSRLYLMVLLGMSFADIENSCNSFGDWGNGSIVNESGSEVPGFGNGFAASLEAGAIFPITTKIYFNLSLGYLHSSVNFPNGTVTTSTSQVTPPYRTSVSQTTMDMKMGIGILQVNFGLCYHL